jgi:thiosulfate/3-mercaptopyruvate sulfurtransferase
MPHDTLVSATELAVHLDDDAWRIFDCRHDLTDPHAGERAYRAGHIPNAQFFHLDRDLSGAKTGTNGRHPLPHPDTLAATLARSGVSNATQVIAYDDAGGMYAARLWWLLRWLGHTRIAVLDGGLQAWTTSGLALTKDAPSIPAAAFSRSHPLVQWIDVQALQAELPRRQRLLIDARAPERYRGEAEPLDAVAGHIPGAVNRFFKDNLDTSGRFKPPHQLRDAFEQLLGGRAPRMSVHYCCSGVTSCHNLLAMHIAGLGDAALYPGSWSEWCSDPERPTARHTQGANDEKR